MVLSYLSEDETLFFMHIPKTAGTSTNEFIVNRLWNRESNYKTPYFYDNNMVNIPQDVLNSYGFITGHITTRSLRSLEKERVTFTILRDPIERAVSSIEHLRNSVIKNVEESSSNHVDYKSANYVAGIDSFDEVIKNELLVKTYLANYQTIQIAGIKIPYRKPLDAFCDNEIYREAIHNLEQFMFVGFQDEMEKSMLQLCYICGWKPTKQVKNSNVNMNKKTKSKEISDETKERMKDFLELDYKIYDYCKSKFQPILDKITYNEVLKNYENVMWEFHRITDIQNIEANDIQFNSGWYNIENAGNRWSGPENESEIDFSINTKFDLECSFDIVGAINKDVIKTFEVEINGIKVDHKINRKKCSFTISKQLIKTNKKLTSVKIITTKTASPFSLGMNLDKRKLGICINNFKISKA